MDECRSKLDGPARGIALRGFWYRESAGSKPTTIEGKFCEHSSHFKLVRNNSHRSDFITHFHVSLERFQPKKKLHRNFASCSVSAVLQSGSRQRFLVLHFEFMQNTSYGATVLFYFSFAQISANV